MAKIWLSYPTIKVDCEAYIYMLLVAYKSL